MFYVLYENRHFLVETWDEIKAEIFIDPYSELNIGLISHHQGFPLLNGAVSLIFIDDEEWLCGCALLRPIEEYNGNETSGWLLSNINLHFRKLIRNDSEYVEELRKRFYTALRDTIISILHPISTRNIYTLSHDIHEHENLKFYTKFNFFENAQYTKEGVLGTIFRNQELRIDLNTNRLCGTSPFVQ